MSQAVPVGTVPASSIPSWVPRGIRYLLIAAVGVVGARFFLRDAVPYYLDYTADQYGRFWEIRWWLIPHIVGGTLAILCGPFQFWSGLRRRHLRIHRLTGRLYLGGVGLGASAATYLAAASPVGVNWSVALLVLAAAWIGASGMALFMIRRRLIDLHKKWMIRSYVVTFAFVTFRWWDVEGLRTFLGDGSEVTILWASWVLPLAATEVVLQLREIRARGRKGAGAKAVPAGVNERPPSG